MQPSSVTEVVGRESELAAVADLLRAEPAERLRLLVVTGAAGSGKSTLVDAALRRATGLEMPVLVARPREPERRLAFNVLADLLGQLPDLAGADLPVPQRAALRHALGLDLPPAGVETDPRLVAAALHAVLASTAAAGRVLVVLDDAHWADASSLLVLPHALHRLRGAAVSVLVATRPSQEADPWPSGEGRVDVHLGPLSEAAVFHLVRSALGRTLGRADLRRIVAVSGGNPMYALELARSGDPSRSGLPPSLEQLVAGAVRALPSSTRRMLVAAALAHDPRLDVVGRAAGLDLTDLEPAALDAAALDASPVAVVEGGRLRFRHPLHATAVVADAAPEDVRATHARLARLETDDEVTARHLAMAADAPDAAIARRLSLAAGQARGRGARAAARDLAALAVSATPPDDPAGPGRRLELAGWALHDGDLQTCVQLAGPLAGGVGPVSARAGVLLASWAALAGTPEQVAAHSRAALAAAEGDPLLRASALVAWADGAAEMGEVAALARSALRELAAAGAESELASDPAAMTLRTRALGAAAQADLMRGVTGPGPELAAAAELEARHPPELVATGARFGQAQALLFSSRLDEARAAFAALVDEARSRGDELSEPLLLLNLGHLELRAGRLAHSGRLAREALALAEVTGNVAARALAELQVAGDEALAGGWPAGEQRLRSVGELAERIGDPWLLAIASTVLGRLRNAQGDATGAVDALRTAARHAARAGLTDPGWEPFPGELTEVLLSLGRDDEAEAELSRLAAAGTGLDRPHLAAVLPRLHAQLRAVRSGADEEALRLSLAAVAAHEGLGTTFELGRSLLVAGRLHRRAKQKRLAHDLLDRAVAAFDANPAPVWADRARDEQRRVGLRPSAPGRLTSTESRVAALAAAGRTNREIAAEVFASPKTVEAVLGRVYRKLGVRSRVELVSVLPAEEDGKAVR